MIEPSNPPSAIPVIDAATRRMAALLQRGTNGKRYRGMHWCTGAGCTAQSDNTDHVILGGRITNSLAVHYLAMHRADVPESEITIVLALDVGEVDPTADEIAGRPSAAPTRRLTRGEMRGILRDEIAGGLRDRARDAGLLDR